RIHRPFSRADRYSECGDGQNRECAAPSRTGLSHLRAKISGRSKSGEEIYEEPTPPSSEEQPQEHWGKALNRLLDEIGPIEMKYPEIEDPVEWVKHLRAEERRHRLGDWGEEE